MDVLKKRYKIINFDGKSNYHTHTFYCDGKNSPEEMVEMAIKLGFRNLGFSGHQFSEYDADYAMSPEKEEKYRADILRLKEDYGHKINIYLGTERDYCSEELSEFDYVIGSTHHLLIPNWDGDETGRVDVDWGPEIVDHQVKKYFGGDYMQYAEAYYEFQKGILRKTRGQIVGHFDLIAIFNDQEKYIDEADPLYMDYARKAASAIVEDFVNNKRGGDLPHYFPEELGEIIDKTGLPIFEINTGAMAKGRREIPYPAPFIIEHLADLGVPMVLNSDCHDRDFLDYGFDTIIQKYNS